MIRWQSKGMVRHRVEWIGSGIDGLMRRSIGALYRTDAEAKKNEQLNCNCTATGFALSRVCILIGILSTIRSVSN